MLKVINCQIHKLGQSFLDEVWGDDDEGRISPDSETPSGRVEPH